MVLQASFQVGMDLYKEQKQGRDENTREDYLIMEQWQKRKTRRLPALYLLCIQQT